MKHFFTIFALVAASSIFSNNAYDQYLEMYKNKEFVDSYDGFKIISETETDTKILDDVYYYLGKIDQKNNNDNEALNNFYWVIKNTPNSSKVKLSYLNSFRILQDNENWEEIITLSKGQDFTEESKNNNKILPIIATANYELALTSTYLDKFKYLDNSLNINKLLLERTKDNLYKEDILNINYQLYRFKVAGRKNYKNTGLNIINELQEDKYFSKKKAERYINRFNRDENKNDFRLIGQVAGNYTDEITAYYDIDLEYIKEFNRNNSIELNISSDYDPNSFKSFNYKNNNNDLKFLQWTNQNSASLSYIVGSSNRIKNVFGVTGSLTNAEDKDDNSYSYSIYNDLSIRFNKLLRFELDSSFRNKIFPDYLMNNNKLDYYTISTTPSFKLNFDNSSIEVGNKLSYKQYLQATYEGSTEDRYYVNNIPEVGFSHSFKYGSLGLKAFYEINNSYNYTLNAIDNYFNYTAPGAEISLILKPVEKLRIKISSEYSRRTFDNYEARDIDNIAIGEKRVDDRIDSEVEVKWNITEIFNVYLSGQYRNTSSNMKYQNSFTTDFEYLVFQTGIGIKL